MEDGPALDGLVLEGDEVAQVHLVHHQPLVLAVIHILQPLVPGRAELHLRDAPHYANHPHLHALYHMDVVDPLVPGRGLVDIHAAHEGLGNNVGCAHPVARHAVPPAEGLAEDDGDVFGVQHVHAPQHVGRQAALPVGNDLVLLQQSRGELLHLVAGLGAKLLDLAQQGALHIRRLLQQRRYRLVCLQAGALLLVDKLKPLVDEQSRHGVHHGALPVRGRQVAEAARGVGGASIVGPNPHHLHSQHILRQTAGLEVHGGTAPGRARLAVHHLPLLPRAKVPVEEAQALHGAAAGLQEAVARRDGPEANPVPLTEDLEVALAVIRGDASV
mmetsp:Transcript_21161/g.58725  ORF Transcript_21161/g.58725 Transcript_21161/m.58725 type:complete len:329 (-) Transcript_21161:1212-2198(-)